MAGDGEGAVSAVTAAEQMVVCMARLVEDGEVVAHGIATPLVGSALILAKRTHAPEAYFACAVGNSLTFRPGKVSLTHPEEHTLGGCLMAWGFADAACSILPWHRPKEFFRPAQVDAGGNFNNVCLGDYAKPRVRLPGCGGIADVTNYSPRIYLYVPRHTRDAFPERIDFRSGIGFPPEGGAAGRWPGSTSPGPRLVITDRCVMDFADGRLRIASLHAGQTLASVRENTGFALPAVEPTPQTLPPTAEELRLLREEIDPHGLRDLELLGTRDRLFRIYSLVAAGQPV